MWFYSCIVALTPDIWQEAQKAILTHYISQFLRLSLDLRKVYLFVSCSMFMCVRGNIVFQQTHFFHWSICYTQVKVAHAHIGCKHIVSYLRRITNYENCLPFWTSLWRTRTWELAVWRERKCPVIISLTYVVLNIVYAWMIHVVLVDGRLRNG